MPCLNPEVHPQTSCPVLYFLTFEPTSLTTPETSEPRIHGKFGDLCFSKKVFPYPSLFIKSIGLMEVALTSTKTWLDSGFGISISSLYSKTDTSPYLAIETALIIDFLFLRTTILYPQQINRNKQQNRIIFLPLCE